MNDTIAKVARQVRAVASAYAAEIYASGAADVERGLSDAAARATTLRGWCGEVAAVSVAMLRAAGVEADFVSGHFNGDAHHCWALVGPAVELLDLTAMQFPPFATEPIVRLAADHPSRAFYEPTEIGPKAMRACLNGEDIARVMEMCRRCGAAPPRRDFNPEVFAAAITAGRWLSAVAMVETAVLDLEGEHRDRADIVRITRGWLDVPATMPMAPEDAADAVDVCRKRSAVVLAPVGPFWTRLAEIVETRARWLAS